MRVHSSDLYYQRGAGLGSFFSNIFRTLIPLTSKVFKVGVRATKTPAGRRLIKAVKRTGINAGLDVVSDAMDGENIAHSVKKRMKEAGKTVANAAGREIQSAISSSSGSTAAAKKKGKKRGVSKKRGLPVVRTLKVGGGGKKKGKGKKKKKTTRGKGRGKKKSTCRQVGKRKSGGGVKKKRVKAKSTTTTLKRWGVR